MPVPASRNRVCSAYTNASLQVSLRTMMWVVKGSLCRDFAGVSVRHGDKGGPLARQATSAVTSMNTTTHHRMITCAQDYTFFSSFDVLAFSSSYLAVSMPCFATRDPSRASMDKCTGLYSGLQTSTALTMGRSVIILLLKIRHDSR
jgi:hypothetical protein